MLITRTIEGMDLTIEINTEEQKKKKRADKKKRKS